MTVFAVSAISPRSMSMRSLLVACATGAIASLCSAQSQVNSGHALDANMQVGSYGYNSRASDVPLAARNYAPYMGSVNAAYQARNAATTYRYGLPNNTYNTFLNDRSYTPVRTSTANAAMTPPSAPAADSSGWQQVPGAPGTTVPASWSRDAAYTQVAPGAYKVDYRVGAGG